MNGVSVVVHKDIAKFIGKKIACDDAYFSSLSTPYEVSDLISHVVSSFTSLVWW